MRWISVLFLSLLVGCAGIQYTPATGEIKYFRIGDQSVEGFDVVKTQDGLHVSLEKQKATGKAINDLVEAVKNLTEVAIKAGL